MYSTSALKSASAQIFQVITSQNINHFSRRFTSLLLQKAVFYGISDYCLVRVSPVLLAQTKKNCLCVEYLYTWRRCTEMKRRCTEMLHLFVFSSRGSFPNLPLVYQKNNFNVLLCYTSFTISPQITVYALTALYCIFRKGFTKFISLISWYQCNLGSKYLTILWKYYSL